ncbi:MAG: SUF system Fe-S cluster assembly regulator [Planctomycetes bacterium]|nr:SUF system Fe-S cluster assembly regulator [Planctomycetota bacterium]
MLRITRQADYGIVLLTLFARSNGRVFSARELASASHVPLPMVGKILKLLVQAEILGSHRGMHGGYTLARRPDEITVGHIIEALDGPVAITDCTGHLPSECGIEQTCPVSHAWQRINDAIVGALDRVTLAEMTCPVGDPLTAFTGHRAQVQP